MLVWTHARTMDMPRSTNICSQDNRAEPNFLTIKAAVILRISNPLIYRNRLPYPQRVYQKKILPGPFHSSSISLPHLQRTSHSNKRPPLHAYPSTSDSLRNERFQRRRILAIWIRVRGVFPSLSLQKNDGTEEFA